jgi:hypothetical protein
MTGAHFSIGVNAASGIVYFLNVRSAQHAARMYWDGGAAASEQLPALRSSSDVAWGFWNRENWGRLGGIRGFMSMMVVNADTMRVIDQVLKMRNADLPFEQRTAGVQTWPGTTFSVDDVEGQALLGMWSPLGSCNANLVSRFSEWYCVGFLPGTAQAATGWQQSH